MKPSIFFFIHIILLSILFVSCEKENDLKPDTNNYLKVGEGVSSGSSFNVEFYSIDSLFVGYNKVYLKITDKNSGQSVNQATMVLRPLMDMGTFTHACPFENPGTSLNSDGYFEGVILFSMIGTNSWSLTVDISANGKSETILFPIGKVISTMPVRKIVVIDSLSIGAGKWMITKYPISLVLPKVWKVGQNSFEITAHRMESKMSFPAATDLTFEIIPEMPSMGHGSPNNLNPVHTSNGHYVGSVNFTMTGAWRINMIVKKGDKTVTNKAWFDIAF